MRFIPITLLMLTLLGGANATTFYVNDNSTFADVYTTAIGNNSNPGTASSPFADLSFAMTVVVSGDSILVDAGNYTDINISIPSTFSSITISGASITTTIFDGTSASGIFNFMDIRGTNIKVEKMTVQNYDSGGAVDIFGSSVIDSTRVNFSDCYFYQNETYTGFDPNPNGGAFYVGTSGANLP
ncbi:MAG: hypothetical protein JKY54_05905, partial [Flavobacteriales bacterium]|nr:hypothetical protein [Flavobacteriales bacterium]